MCLKALEAMLPYDEVKAVDNFWFPASLYSMYTIESKSNMNGTESQKPMIPVIDKGMMKNGASRICNIPVILYKIVSLLLTVIRPIPKTILFIPINKMINLLICPAKPYSDETSTVIKNRGIHIITVIDETLRIMLL